MSITAFTAFKDSSGKLYTTLGDVQTAERRGRYLAVFDKAKKEQPDLARLDHKLVVDLLMAHGPLIGIVANDPLTPEAVVPEKLIPATPAGKLNPESSSTEEKGGRFENAPRFPSGGIVGADTASERKVTAHHPAFAAPYGGNGLVVAGRTGGRVDDLAGSRAEGMEPKAILTGSRRDENLYAIVADAIGRDFPGNEDLYAEGDLRRAAGVADRGN